MRTVRAYFVVLCLLMGAAGSAQAWVSININLFPELVPVPGYPVYYAPLMSANYFFYDGMYWVYEDDDWYVSDWYNGPWEYVDPVYVPVYVLRIPVRYYRRPPVYFREWRVDAAPRWGYHWGREWESRRSGWDRWDRARVPAIAPLPVYQRQYSGDRYPRAEEQREIRSNNYRYQPRNAMVRERYESPAREVHESARENRYERQPSPQRESGDRQVWENRERTAPSSQRDNYPEQRYERERAASQQHIQQPVQQPLQQPVQQPMPSAQQQWPTRRDSTRQDSMRQEPNRQDLMRQEQTRQEQIQREPSRQSREFNARGNNGSDSPPDRGRGHDRGRNDDRGGH